MCGMGPSSPSIIDVQAGQGDPPGPAMKEYKISVFLRAAKRSENHVSTSGLAKESSAGPSVSA